MSSRKRRVEHISGNFATLIAIRVTQISVLSELAALQATYHRSFPTAELLNLKTSDRTVLGPHISLSPTQYLKSHQLEAFVSRVAAVVSVLPPIVLIRIPPSPLCQFPATFQDENTDREPAGKTAISGEGFFGVLEIDPRTIDTTIGPLLNAIDTVIGEFGGQKLPKPPRPHISLFFIPHSQVHMPSDFQIDSSDICFTVRSVVVRVGKCHVNIPLGRPQTSHWSLEQLVLGQTTGGDTFEIDEYSDSDEE